jgi:hypothetical protein
MEFSRNSQRTMAAGIRQEARGRQRINSRRAAVPMNRVRVLARMRVVAASLSAIEISGERCHHEGASRKPT